MVTRGFCSETFAFEAIEDRGTDRRPYYVYYLGDFDRAGRDAAASLRKKLMHFAASKSIEVEFIGLESWSPEKLAAAVKDKCKDKYCAATLKQDLGFAEAAVMIHAGPQPRTVVAVVEPQFSSRVRYKPAPEVICSRTCRRRSCST